MQITLAEDNGFMNDGKPTLVVLVITDDDGKKTRIPYEANRTIQELYEDVAKMPAAGKKSFIEDETVRDFQSIISGPAPVVRVNVIEREDVVKCVKVIERDKGLEPSLIPKLGHDYRVINVIRKEGAVTLYELLDDASDNKIRIPVYPAEVELLRKHVPPPPRKNILSVTKICEKCGENNAINLHVDGERFEGECTQCQAIITEARKKEEANGRNS